MSYCSPNRLVVSRERVWTLEARPVIDWLSDSPSRGLVSKIYADLTDALVGKLPTVRKWEEDLTSKVNTTDWRTVWSNIFRY